MYDFENLIARCSVTILQKDIGQKMMEKMVEKIQVKYGMSLHHALNDFSALYPVLVEFYGKEGAKDIKSKLSEHIAIFEDIWKNPTVTKHIEIKNKKLFKNYMSAYCNYDTVKLLSQFEEPIVPVDACDKVSMSQTSAYRKVSQLINDGLLIFRDYGIGSDGRKATRYSTWLDGKICIGKKKVSLKIKVRIECTHDKIQLSI